MNRIDEKFIKLKKCKRKALITFITAGDPSLMITEKLVYEMEKSGADIIELGIPYSDPLADGPIIQASSKRALDNKTSIKEIMETVKNIRLHSNIPLIYLVYYNSIFKYGKEKFIEEAKESGIDGLIIPDLPLEEREEIMEITNKENIYLIPLVAPTSKERISKITNNAKGFIYCVSLLGVTGVRDEIKTDIKEYMESVSSYSPLPRILGFGISSPTMAKNLCKYGDGVIVGSKIIDIISKYKKEEEILKNISSFVKELSLSIK